MSREHVQITRADRVLRIVIDRPRKKNALTGEMYAAIADALLAAEADGELRVHYITATGSVFTAGNDMASFLHPEDGLTDVLRLLEVLRTLEKPLVVAVNGLAVGIGVTMLLHADLVYAADTATFRTPFVDLGVVPEAGSSLLMPAAMGYPRAARMLLLGETFDAQQAYDSLLISEVVPAVDLDAHATARAAALARRAPAAVRATKALMRRASTALVKEQMDTEARIFRERLSSPELIETVTAFLEKRPPDFSSFE
jgi:enoyl-CoA hydratase/carnithine racemase